MCFPPSPQQPPPLAHPLCCFALSNHFLSPLPQALAPLHLVRQPLLSSSPLSPTLQCSRAPAAALATCLSSGSLGLNSPAAIPGRGSDHQLPPIIPRLYHPFPIHTFLGDAPMLTWGIGQQEAGTLGAARERDVREGKEDNNLSSFREEWGCLGSARTADFTSGWLRDAPCARGWL